MLAQPKVNLYHSYHVHGGFHLFEFKEEIKEDNKRVWSVRFKWTPDVWSEITVGSAETDGEGDCWVSPVGKEESHRIVPMHVSKEWLGAPYPLYLTRSVEKYSRIPVNFKLPERTPSPQQAVGGQAQ